MVRALVEEEARTAQRTVKLGSIVLLSGSLEGIRANKEVAVVVGTTQFGGLYVIPLSFFREHLADRYAALHRHREQQLGEAEERLWVPYHAKPLRGSSPEVLLTGGLFWEPLP